MLWPDSRKWNRPQEDEAVQGAAEEQIERKLGLHEQRLERVAVLIAELGASSVLDLGCGGGKLLRLLLKSSALTKITGVDVSVSALECASGRLGLERMAEAKRQRIELIHGSVLYRDPRFAEHDVAALVEVIEHLDPPRLAAMARVVFEYAQPKAVIITTPNGEYNVRFEGMTAGAFRHKDHRFEWDRPTFEAWAREVAERYGYGVCFEAVGEVVPEVGAPSQLVLFTRVEESGERK